MKAAPLKPGGHCERCSPVPTRFPPSNEGGPVEASDLRSLTHLSPPFRLRMKAAPLKLEIVVDELGGDDFPPSNEGGPVEATPYSDAYTSSASGLSAFE